MIYITYLIVKIQMDWRLNEYLHNSSLNLNTFCFKMQDIAFTHFKWDGLREQSEKNVLKETFCVVYFVTTLPLS